MPRHLILVSLFVPMCGFAAAIVEHAKVTELWAPIPSIVIPGDTGAAPSDAIVLFDGTDLSQWQSANGGEATWAIDRDGSLTVVAGARDIRTKTSFADVQLHIEWRTPSTVTGAGQGRGNSGVFLMERYEVQVLDSVDNPTYANGQAASIYKQHIPLVNASRGPGEWQSYDIVFAAPRFGTNERVAQPATVTVLHNGVLVQNHVTIQGPTVYVGSPRYHPHDKAPILLQDHGDPVSYRNIWVREL